jgi:hypothetical protein
MAEEDRGRRRGPGLLVGAIAVAATASLGTLALVGSPAGTRLAGNVTASFVNAAPDGGSKGQPTPTPDGKGKGQPTPTPSGKGKGQPTPTPSGKGKGQPTPTPSGKGKGQPTPTPSGKGNGQPTPTPSGKGFGPYPTITTFATAQQVAGFRVRTLAGLPGAQLDRVTVEMVTFDTASGQPTEPSVTLVYSVGQMQVSVTEVTDPLPMPAAQTASDELTVGGSTYVLLPGTGPVNSASTKAQDGVSVVASFFTQTSAGVTGADRQIVQQVLQQLG